MQAIVTGKIERDYKCESCKILKNCLKIFRNASPNFRSRNVSNKTSPNYNVPLSLYYIGWGRTRPIISVTASHLKQAEAPLATYKDCRRKNGDTVDDDAMVCVGGQASSVCNGDSGGSLENGRWVLRGAASWVTRYICPKHRYSVYARVSSYVNWISEQIQGT